jgi:hypothetical protein
MRSVRILAVAFLASAAIYPADVAKKNLVPRSQSARAEDSKAVIWRDPADIATRNLYYGSGGEENQPHGPYTFVKEDLKGSNPKFTVHDGRGEKWKVKLGAEARSETAAAHIVWAAGYFTDNDYFVPDLQVAEMPRKLHRGQKLVGAGGVIARARFEREFSSKDEGIWKWKSDPFMNTREWNGLRVLMALLNNWDLKDVNNTIYRSDSDSVYTVSDLGATFGTPGIIPSLPRARDNLASYERSKFITRTTQEYVDFATPARPAWECIVDLKDYIHRVHMEWIGRNIPREDARWIGQVLSRLTPEQLLDAFRGAGYSDDEARAFARVLQARISALASL